MIIIITISMIFINISSNDKFKAESPSHYVDDVVAAAAALLLF